MNFECNEKQRDLLVAGLQHVREQSEEALTRTAGCGIATAKDRYDLAKERDGAIELMATLTGQTVFTFS